MTSNRPKSDLDWEALIGTQYEIVDNVRRGYELCEQIEGHIRDAHILLAKIKRLTQATSGAVYDFPPAPED